MYHFFEAIQNTSGDALPGYLVKLFDSSGTIVPIYSDSAGTPIVNVSGIDDTAVVADDGNVALYVNPGVYSLGIYSPSGAQQKLIEDYAMGFQVITTSSGSSVNLRSLIAAIVSPVAGQSATLTEPGREGAFVFDSANLSAQVTADPLQGIYVAPSTDTSGASGAWVRTPGITRMLDAAHFGLSETATDAANHAALAAALSLAGTLGYYKGVHVAPGSYTLSASVAVPDGITLQGSGVNTVLIAGNASGSDPWLIDQTDGAGFTIRDLKLTCASSGAITRSAIRLVTCSDACVKSVTMAGQSDANGMYLFDCNNIVVDAIFFDGGSSGKHGTAVYNSGGQDCKVSNSHSINCFAGFTISSAQTDFDITPVASPRDVADVYANTITNCTVVNCTSQAYTITGATGNTIANSHAHDYAGVSTHKAFQIKDTVGDPTRGNVITGCTVNNYPAGFGGQQGSHAKFVACVARNCTTNAFEINSCTAFSIYACSAYEFAGAGIWTSSGTVRCHIDGVQLETSTTTAIGVSMGSLGGSDTNNNFDNVTTASPLASFINIASGCNNNRFGRGCRSGGSPIIDSSGNSEWPVISVSPVALLTATSKNYLVPYFPRGMNVAVARFIITTTIAGTTSPQIAVGRDGSSAIVAANQTVTGAATAVVNLTLVSTSTVLANGQIPTWNVVTAAAGTGAAGAGYLQIEGLLAN